MVEIKKLTNLFYTLIIYFYYSMGIHSSKDLYESHTITSINTFEIGYPLEKFIKYINDHLLGKEIYSEFIYDKVNCFKNNLKKYKTLPYTIRQPLYVELSLIDDYYTSLFYFTLFLKFGHEPWFDSLILIKNFTEKFYYIYLCYLNKVNAKSIKKIPRRFMNGKYEFVNNIPYYLLDYVLYQEMDHFSDTHGTIVSLDGLHDFHKQKVKIKIDNEYKKGIIHDHTFHSLSINNETKNITINGHCNIIVSGCIHVVPITINCSVKSDNDVMSLISFPHDDIDIFFSKS